MDKYQEIMARGGTAWKSLLALVLKQKLLTKKRVHRDAYYQEFLHTKES